MNVGLEEHGRLGRIYVICNRLNDKKYVGQTCLETVEQRFKSHLDSAKYGSNLHLHRAMRKHGVESFDIQQLEECSAEDIDEREKFWINELKTFGSAGYNSTIGGQHGFRDRKHSEETKKKCSEVHRGIRQSMTTRANKRAAMRACTHCG